jgi:hypothetical protein
MFQIDSTTLPATLGIARVIQLSVAPVFLLTGVSALLGVFTNRLARIIDRARLLEGSLILPPEMQPPHIHDDLRTLSKRARLINTGITLCVATALFVCAVIVTLFVGAFLQANVTSGVTILFIVAMVALIGALISFLLEIFKATATLRIGPH